MSQPSLLPQPFTRFRKLIAISLACALGCALLFLAVTSFAVRHQHNKHFDKLSYDMQSYFTRYFDDVRLSSTNVMPQLATTCDKAIPVLTASATFNINIRTLTLVDGGRGYCSSGTGNTGFSVRQYVPNLNTHAPYDVALVAGTLKLPTQPSLIMWHRVESIPGRGVLTTLNFNITSWLLYQALPHHEVDVALIVKNRALTTFNAALVAVDTLPANYVRTVNLAKYGITLRIYPLGWTDNEIWFTAIGTLASAAVAGLLCAWLLATALRPGKEILNAIRRNYFWIAYQPVIDAKSGEVTGVEALMRWENPGSGAISPDIFIAVAEAQQMIIPLTRHLFSLVANDAPELMKALPRGAKIGVNLAPSHLYSPDFKEDVLRFATALPANYFQIVFEITERDMLKEREAVALFHWLHLQGFEIAVDDFGTGHSALIYLERFTLDYLKIDREFINTIGDETVNSPVLDAVLTLAQRLKMLIVAEGVETEKQAEWLKSRKVQYLQGYFYSRPLTISQLVSYCHMSQKPLR